MLRQVYPTKKIGCETFMYFNYKKIMKNLSNCKNTCRYDSDNITSFKKDNITSFKKDNITFIKNREFYVDLNEIHKEINVYEYLNNMSILHSRNIFQ